MKLYMRAFQFEFDRGRYTRALREVVEREFRNALYAFLEAAERRIPVDTGQARGSLQPIAEYAGYVLELSMARPTSRKGPNTRPGTLRLNFDWPSMSVSFRVDIDYFEMYERTGTFPHSRTGRPINVPTAPWRTLYYGREAFKDHLRRHLKENIPRVTEFFTRTSIEYSR